MLSNQEAMALIANASRRSAFGALSVGNLAESITSISKIVAKSLSNGGKILVFGNGGSAGAAQHFAAEFSGKLKNVRPPLAAIALSADSVALTAIGNDFGFNEIFARQVVAIANAHDVVIGLSTSGKSENVRRGLAAGKEIGAITIGLVGSNNDLGSDMSIAVPVADTPRIQESHELVLHQIAQLSERFLTSVENDSSADVFDFVIQRDRLLLFRKWIEDTQQTLVTTNGVFDLLHAGHRASLKAARALGDMLVVCVNADDSVKALKGSSRPIQTLADRLESLSELPSVDHVVVFDQDSPSRVLEDLQPSIHAKGGDYLESDLKEREVVLRNGGRIVILPTLEGYSTTSLLGES